MAKTIKSGRTLRKVKKINENQTRKHEIVGILLLAFSCLCIVSLYLAPANSLTPPTTGIFGNLLAQILTGLAGKARYLLAVIMGIWGFTIIMQKRWPMTGRRMYGFLALFLCGLTLLHLPLIWSADFWAISRQGAGGGLIGAVLAKILVGVFGVPGSYIVLGFLTVVTILSITNLSIVEIFKKALNTSVVFGKGIKESLEQFLFVTVEEEEEENKAKPGKTGEKSIVGELKQRPVLESLADELAAEGSWATSKRTGSGPSNTGELDFELVGEAENAHPYGDPRLNLERFSQPALDKNLNFDGESDEEIVFPTVEGFILPSLDLLKPIAKDKGNRLQKSIQENTRILEETLENFGVKVQVSEVSQGPAITRYEIQPAKGIKVSKIMGLADDIALSMAAQQVRIEAPIPGKSAIGIEVPNQEISLVHLREVLESEEFKNSNSRLTVAFGKDIAGRAVVGDLTKMPHLLIAGATGMGKSVCLNSLISSILFKSNPQEVKFLMIDPKMVELTTYNGIPHLMTPVVTNPKKAAVSLRWAVAQMEQRYEKFAAVGAKDITRYNKVRLKEQHPEEMLPYIVIIIDELADLMMIAPADVEDAVCRLAQMARAAGIHLVLATQRPSVDVITGLIKANIPSRIAFAVSSQMDSRTILDVGGAEKLVGRGDMLYMPVGYAKPVRVQGPFISDEEVEQLVYFLKKQEKPLFVEGITEGESNKPEEPEAEDELYLDAVRLFIESGQASISLLQRRFRIGYTRAARLIDLMEKRGAVGPFEGSKPREVLLTIEAYESKYGKF